MSFKDVGMADLNSTRDWQELAVEMLIEDADSALQSIASLLAGGEEGAASSLVHHTREAYDMIGAKRKNLPMSASDASALEDKLDRLRAQLKYLGEAV